MTSADRPRVLIADDHPGILERVVALLSRDFTIVGTVGDGAQLVAAEADGQADVLVVDICMPHMTGLEAIEAVRSRGSRVPVICLSAHLERDIVEAAWTAG